MDNKPPEHEYVPVPCNTCTACCVGPKGYKWYLALDAADAIHCKMNGLVVDPRPTGNVISLTDVSACMWSISSKPFKNECRYLGANGCTVYDKRPLACRVFDCRELPKSVAPIHLRIAAEAAVWRTKHKR